MKNLVIFCMCLGTIQAVIGSESFSEVEPINGKECQPHCNGTQSCNQCVFQCTTVCQSRQQCCNRCVEDCSKGSRNASTLTSVSPGGQNQTVDISSNISLINAIHNHNEIHSPVTVNSTNQNIINLSRIGHSPTYDQKNCCQVIVPNCTQTPCTPDVHRECSPRCISPVIYIQRIPVIKHVPVDRPVPVPQPYPVKELVPVDRPVPRPYPVPVPVPQPVPQPYPVEKPVPVPIIKPVTVTRTIPIPQLVPIFQHVPVPVERPVHVLHPGPVPVPQPYIHNSCRYIQRHPWVECRRYGIHDCSPCYNCGAGIPPQQCQYGSGCSTICRQVLVPNPAHRIH